MMKITGTEFRKLGNGWEVYDDLAFEDVSWEDRLVGNGGNIVSLDCPCNPNDEDTPGYDDMPYDVHISSPFDDPQACPRCGRLFKLEVAQRVVMYTPVDIRYPGTTRDVEAIS